MGQWTKMGFAIFAACAALVLVSLAPNTSLAQGEKWSRPVPVSGFTAGSEFPNLAIDGSGNVHVVWTSAQGDQGNLVYYSRWDGEAWTRPVDIRFGGDRPVIAVDGFGDLDLIYIKAGKATYVRAANDQAASSKGWFGEHIVSPSGVTSAVQLAIDQEGTFHVVRTQHSGECPICSSILYQRSTDGGDTWSDPVTLSIQPADSFRVQLKIDAHDRLHVAWDGLGAQGSNQSVRYTYSIDHGNSWAPAQQFFGPKGLPTQSAIGVGANDQIMLVWQTMDHDVIYYQVSEDAGMTWGQPTLVPDMAPGQSSTGTDNYSMATDSAGTIHLAATGRGTNADIPSLYHLQWDGKKWSKPDPVYSGPDFPEYPTIVVSDGNRLHLTWFTQGADSVSKTPDSTFQVWYSTLLTAAAAVAPAPTFTPLPLPTSTPAPETATPAPTSTPPVFSASNPASSADTGPFQQQISVLAGIIPAILIIGIVIAIKLRPRRMD